MKVGFIGTGKMGLPMARHVLKGGHTLTVHDLDRAHAAPLLESGARWADSPDEVGRASQVVFTSLPIPADVEAVSQSLLEGMKPGSVFVDLSTNSPTVIRRIAALFAQRGVKVLDAPVSGGVDGAESGTLSIMVGGPKAVYDRVKPILDIIGDKAMYCGPIGAGTVCKLVNNLLSMGVGVLLAEAFTLGIKAGVDAETLYEAVRRSSGNTRRMERRWPLFLLKGNLKPGFALSLAAKDVALATALGREMKAPMPLASLVEQAHVEALARGYGHLDSDAIALLQEERVSVQIRFKREGGKR